MAIRGNGSRAIYFMRKTAPFFILLLITTFLFPSMTLAQVQTRLRVIQASNVGSNIDPSLKDVHGELGSLFNFTSYRLLREENLKLSLNQTASISAHRGRTSLEVTLVGQHKNVAELKIKVNREGTDILNTQVRLYPGRTVLVGGPKHGEGVIIYAVSAHF